METVYTVVKEAPLEVKPHEFVVGPLSFADAVKGCSRQRGGKAAVGANYLRSVAAEVGRRYDKHFNPYRHVVPTDYAGINAETDEEIGAVVKQMFDARYPKIYNSYYETVVKNLPFGIRVVYVVGQTSKVEAFDNSGIRMVTPEQAGLLLQAVESSSIPAVVEEELETVPLVVDVVTDEELDALNELASVAEIPLVTVEDLLNTVVDDSVSELESSLSEDISSISTTVETLETSAKAKKSKKNKKN